MKPFATPILVLLALPASLLAASGDAREAQSASTSSETVFRVSSNLVLIDVMASNGAKGTPDITLARGDFQVLDNGRPVSIKTFDAGTAIRPLALWFVVQCNMKGWEANGSGLFAGQIGRFDPALTFLEKRDKVAVAHWCDNGDSKLDLLPTSNIAQAAPVLEQALAPIPDPRTHDRSGELALQKTLQLIVNATYSLSAETLPVVIFLYGDYSGMPKPEADRFIYELLETSAIVYGLKDSRSPRIGSLWIAREQSAIANYIAVQTGGQYLTVTPETYATGLKEIVEQLHFRYELGFKPKSLDGKRHRLRVKLADAAIDRHKGVHLQYRSAYVPIAH
jgi:hypothetical protein